MKYFSSLTFVFKILTGIIELLLLLAIDFELMLSSLNFFFYIKYVLRNIIYLTLIINLSNEYN